MAENRDTFIFYRSFFEAINPLQDADRLKLYDAICEYSLNIKDTELQGVAAGFFTLIKPQLDANRKRYENGSKPKTKQRISKKKAKNKQTVSETEANKNKNNNVNKNNNPNENTIPTALGSLFSTFDFIGKEELKDRALKFAAFVDKELPTVQSLKHPISADDAIKILENFDTKTTIGVLRDMENHAGLLKKYKSAYSTFSSWAERREKDVQRVG